MKQFINDIIEFFYGSTYTKEQLEQYKMIGCRGIENERPWDILIIMGGFFLLVFLPFFYTSIINALPPLGLVYLFTSFYMCFDINSLIQKDQERRQENVRRMERFIRHLEKNIANQIQQHLENKDL